MGRLGRAWSILAVAVLLLAAASPAADPAPVAFAAPAAGIDRSASAGLDHPAAAKAGTKQKKARDKGARNRAERNVKNRGGKKNKPKPTPTPPASAPAPTPAPTPPPPPAPAPAACQRIAVPAYFEPQEYWDRINAAAPTTGLVILNPNSGPDKPDATWRARTRAAQQAGITVVGYVLTGLGTRPQKAVKADIDAYFAWFGVDGVYLDETSSDPEDVPYYRAMADYARSVKPGAVVAVNPGYTPDEAFMQFADFVETYEFDYATYKTQEFPAWTKKYPAERFIHVVHSVPGPEAARKALALARERNAGYVFLTDVEDPAIIYKSLGGNLWDEQVGGACA